MVSVAALAVIALAHVSCSSEECDPSGSILFSVDVCADTSPEARPTIGGVCVQEPGCIPEAYGWSCHTASLEPGVCTFSTLLGGQPVTFELELVYKQRGPCDDGPAPVDCCADETPALGPCGGADGGTP